MLNDKFNEYHTADCANCGEIDDCRVMTENWKCFEQLDCFLQHAWLVCDDCIAILKSIERHEVACMIDGDETNE